MLEPLFSFVVPESRVKNQRGGKDVRLSLGGCGFSLSPQYMTHDAARHFVVKWKELPFFRLDLFSSGLGGRRSLLGLGHTTAVCHLMSKVDS